jgi:hypothetical protein
LADAFLDAVLRLVGAFYAVGSLFGLKRMAADFLLTQAIGAIGKPKPLEARAEKERNLALTSSLLLVGIGGIVLLAGLEPAAFIFFVSLLLYAGYLFILAPLRLDPHDPPEEPGRGQTRNAFWIYLAATALVGAAWRQGRLTPLAAASPTALAFAGAAALALIVFAARLRLQARLKGPAWSGASAGDESPPAGMQRTVEEDLAHIRSRPLVMRPSWDRGALFDAGNGEAVTMPLFEGYALDDDDALAQWNALFAELGDRDDPLRAGLKDGDAVRKLDEAGRPVFEKLSRTLGHPDFTFDPKPAPMPPRRAASRVKLMSDYPQPPLWIMDGDVYEPVEPSEFGISRQLDLDIAEWETACARSWDADDPGADPRWTEAQFLEHEEQGRRLAVRLARELAATGRGAVEVNAYRRSDGIYPVRAGDPV